MKLLGILCIAFWVLGIRPIPSCGQQVAITVDDLPAHSEPPEGVTQVDIAQSFLKAFHAEHLPKIYGFVNGVHTEEEPEDMPVLTAWHSAHQPLGNHTWSHPDLNDLTSEAFLAEVDKDTEYLKRIDGKSVRWFRYPFLHEGDTLEKRRAVRAGLAQRGYRIAEVSLDFEDYLWNSPYARCSDQHNAAAMQYLHDSYLATANHYIDVGRGLSQQAFHRDIRYVLLLHMGAFDAKMFPELVALFRKRGFQFITLDLAMQDKAYRIDPGNGDESGGSFQELVLEARHESVAPDEKPYEALEKLCPAPVEPASPIAQSAPAAPPHLP